MPCALEQANRSKSTFGMSSAFAGASAGLRRLA
jgi:hypothetical protein